MMSILGCVLKSWIMVLCSMLYITSANIQGENGTFAQNFFCTVYTVNISSMNCTWEAGKNAPKDTQYFLYLKYEEEKEATECPHYITDSLGRHVACHFPNITVNEKEVGIELNRSSKESPIQELKFEELLYMLERLAPPQNITVECDENTSSCNVTWRPPPTSRHVRHADCFKYNIMDEIRNEHEVLEKTYKKYSNDAKYILRFQTGGTGYCPITSSFGAWSDPIEFGTEPNTFPIINLVIVILGTFIAIVFLLLISKRYRIWQLLTLPVPQPKDIIQKYEYNMEKMWLGLVSSGDENVTTIEEVNSKNTHHLQEITSQS